MLAAAQRRASLLGTDRLKDKSSLLGLTHSFKSMRILHAQNFGSSSTNATLSRLYVLTLGLYYYAYIYLSRLSSLFALNFYLNCCRNGKYLVRLFKNLHTIGMFSIFILNLSLA